MSPSHGSKLELCAAITWTAPCGEGAVVKPPGEGGPHGVGSHYRTLGGAAPAQAGLTPATRPERRRPVEALRIASLFHSLDDPEVEHEQLDPDAGDVAEFAFAEELGPPAPSEAEEQEPAPMTIKLSITATRRTLTPANHRFSFNARWMSSFIG